MLTKRLKDYRLLVFLILAITAIAFYLRSIYTEPVSDDLLYSFILDNHGLGDNAFDKKVESFNDAIKSQLPQYLHHSGRLPIHVIVQMFAGPWGRSAWNIFNTFIFVSTIVLFVWFTAKRGVRYNPLIWLLASITFLYLFQSNSLIWYSIAGGMNYLFPLFMSLIFLILLNRISDKHTNHWWAFVVCMFVGLLMGWCQECYSIPLAGATFIYALVRRKSINRFQITLFVSLWIGTAILVLAPGNFERLGNASRLQSIINGLNLLLGTKLFWILVILLIISHFNKSCNIRKFIHENALLTLCLGFSLLLGFSVNTLPQSFNGIAFFSALLSFRLISKILWTDFSGYKSWITFLTLIVLLICHQTDIIINQNKIKKASLTAINQIKATGTFAIPDINITPTSRPFINNWFDTTVPRWTFFTLKQYYVDNSLTYTESKNDIIALHQLDYGFYTNPHDLFIPTNHIPGNNQLYMGDFYIWAKAHDIKSGIRYKYTYYPISPNDTDNLLLKIKFALFPHLYENEEIVVLPDTNCINIDSCYRVFPKPGIRKIKSIDIIQ